MNGRLKLLLFLLFLAAPAFLICLDAAVADYMNGITVDDAWGLAEIANNPYKMAEYEHSEKLSMLAQRYWLAFSFAFIAGLVVGNAVWEPYSPPAEEGKVEEVLVSFGLGMLILMGMLAPIGLCPFLIACLRDALFHGGVSRAMADVAEMSLAYSYASLRAFGHSLYEACKHNPILALAALIFPIFGPGITASTAQLPFMVRKWKTEKPRETIIWSLLKNAWPETPGHSRDINEEVATGHSYAKQQSPPDVSAFTSHIRRSIGKAKRGGGDRKMMKGLFGREDLKAAEKKHKLKRKEGERDRPYYIA